MSVVCDCVIDGVSKGVAMALYICAQNMNRAKKNNLNSDFACIFDEFCNII